MTAAKIIGALWLTLFGILLTFLMGVVVWAVAGPTLAIVIFCLVLVVFVWFPLSSRRRGTTKSPPHH